MFDAWAIFQGSSFIFVLKILLCFPFPPFSRRSFFPQDCFVDVFSPSLPSSDSRVPSQSQVMNRKLPGSCAYRLMRLNIANSFPPPDRGISGKREPLLESSYDSGNEKALPGARRSRRGLISILACFLLASVFMSYEIFSSTTSSQTRVNVVKRMRAKVVPTLKLLSLYSSRSN